MSSIKIVFTLPFILNLAAASEQPPLAAGEVRTYDDIRGVIESLQPNESFTVIYHEEIPGFLEAMAAVLRAGDSHEFDGLKPGDGISFCLHVTRENGWIDAVKVVKTAPAHDNGGV